jgi:hypothetical protein
MPTSGPDLALWGPWVAILWVPPFRILYVCPTTPSPHATPPPGKLSLSGSGCESHVPYPLPIFVWDAWMEAIVGVGTHSRGPPLKGTP